MFKILEWLSGNRFFQKLLERNVNVSQYLMGIGSGKGVFSSGERAIFQVLKEKCVPPYCIFDVGSNKGQFLRLICSNVSGDNHSIHCFEPGHSTFEILKKENFLGKNVSLNRLGLGRDRGTAVLHYDSAGSGLASLTKRNLDHFSIKFEGNETVRIDSIDNYCAENAIVQIDLLKIDIEGHELDALAGAKKMFASKAIRLVTFEFGGCNIDTRTFFVDYWRFFKEGNFDLFRITPSGYLIPLKSYKESYEQFRTMNFLAILRA